MSGRESRGSAASRSPLVMLIVANVVSTVGGSMSLVALPWFVYRSTGSSAATGLAATCEFVAVMVASLFAGNVIARLGARRTRVLSDVISGLAVVAIPIADDVSALPYGLLLGLVALNGLLRTPAVAASFLLLRDATRRAGTSTDSVSGPYLASLQLAGTIGAPTAGAAIAFFGAPAVLVIDAATFLVSALLIQVALPVVAPAQSEAAPSLRNAFRVLIGDKVLLPLVGAGIVSATVFSAWSTVMAPIYGQTILHNSLLLGVLLGAQSIGGIGGNTIARRVAAQVPRGLVFPAAIAVAIVPAFTALALAASIPVLITTMLVAGLASGIFTARLVSTEYERIPEAEQGHAFGLIGGLGQAGVAIGPSLAGVILIKTPLPVAFAGIVIIGLAVATALTAIPAMRSTATQNSPIGRAAP